MTSLNSLDDISLSNLNEHVLFSHDYILKQLKQDYPLKYVIIDSIIMIILNMSLISLQIFAMNHNAALSFIGSAIWSGVYNLIAIFLALMTSKYYTTILIVIS